MKKFRVRFGRAKALSGWVGSTPVKMGFGFIGTSLHMAIEVVNVIRNYAHIYISKANVVHSQCSRM